MKYQGIIFDLDGVICHTDQYHYQAWKALADKRHIPFDETVNNRLRGVSRMESLEIILEKDERKWSQTEKEEMAAHKNECYQSLLQKMSPADVEEEVLVTLRKLRERHILLAIGSSSKNARLILEKIGLTGYFDRIVDGNCISKSKPDPEVFLTAARYLGLLPGQCLVVEDAKSGVEAALAGGFDCAGLGDAREYGNTTFPLEHLEQLLDLL